LKKSYKLIIDPNPFQVHRTVQWPPTFITPVYP
jgi:hypothetical protein